MSQLVNELIEASKTMSDKVKLALAAELADAADVVRIAFFPGHRLVDQSPAQGRATGAPVG